jgi:hypothetical protein
MRNEGDIEALVSAEEEFWGNVQSDNPPALDGSESTSEAIAKVYTAQDFKETGTDLVPIRFTEHYIDEKLMSPKRGAPVLVRQNRFTGWSADITVQYIAGGSFSLEQIIQVINLAGFSMGIGSGRTSGYGRYHVSGVKS